MGSGRARSAARAHSASSSSLAIQAARIWPVGGRCTRSPSAPALGPRGVCGRVAPGLPRIATRPAARPADPAGAAEAGLVQPQHRRRARFAELGPAVRYHGALHRGPGHPDRRGHLGLASAVVDRSSQPRPQPGRGPGPGRHSAVCSVKLCRGQSSTRQRQRRLRHCSSTRPVPTNVSGPHYRHPRPVALLSLLPSTARIKESWAALVQARRATFTRSRSESPFPLALHFMTIRILRRVLVGPDLSVAPERMRL
jgi:hypothetical protein